MFYRLIPTNTRSQVKPEQSFYNRMMQRIYNRQKPWHTHPNPHPLELDGYKLNFIVWQKYLKIFRKIYVVLQCKGQTLLVHKYEE